MSFQRPVLVFPPLSPTPTIFQVIHIAFFLQILLFNALYCSWLNIRLYSTDYYLYITIFLSPSNNSTMNDPNYPQVTPHSTDRELSAKTKRKRNQSVVRVQYPAPQGSVDISRNEDGNFICSLCLKAYQDPWSMQKHALKHRESTIPQSNETNTLHRPMIMNHRTPYTTCAPSPIIQENSEQMTTSGASTSRATLTPNYSMLGFIRSGAYLSSRETPPSNASSTLNTGMHISTQRLGNPITPTPDIFSDSQLNSSTRPTYSSRRPYQESHPSLPSASIPSRSGTRSTIHSSSCTVLRSPSSSPLFPQHLPTPAPLTFTPFNPLISSVKEESTEFFIPREISREIIDLTFDDDTPEPDIPNFDPYNHRVMPDEYTVVEHPTCNLSAMGIIINTLLKCAICIECAEGIEPLNISSHARKHNPHHNIADTAIDDLITEYGLVTMEHVPYPSYPIPPLFGLPIEPQILHFCTTCHRGFHTPSTLRSHQSNMARCHVSVKDRASYDGYGQIITKGKHKRFFPIIVPRLEQQRTTLPDYSLIFENTMPPPTDYSKTPIRNVDDQQNISSFLFREGWLDAITGYLPEEVVEAARIPNDDDEPWARVLQKAAHRSLAQVQPLISEHHGFGLTEAIAQFYPITEAKGNNLNLIQPTAQRAYGDKVCRLLFNLIRSMSPGWSSRVQYPPLDQCQINALQALRDTLDLDNEEAIDTAFHDACYMLYAHERHQYPISEGLNNFFSPVNLFLVYASLRTNGTFRLVSEMTGICAAFEYSIRSVMLIEINCTSKVKHIKAFDVLGGLCKYLQTGHETPMSFIFNAHRLLKAIRSDEVNDPKFRFSDPYGREVTYNGDLIRLVDVKRMHDMELERYRDYIREELFFGEDIPSDIFPVYEFEDLVDSVNNSAVGYCFLDDPRNGFDRFRDAYGRWLLSDPDRAERFVYYHNGKLLWKPDAAVDLLRRLESSRGILAPGVAYSSLLQVRASEFARVLLRNTTGASRNLRMEYHILTYVALQDKTSHQHLKDRYIPHPITRPWATELVNHLVIFRPFEEFLVTKLMSEDILHTYRTQLWPCLKGTLTPEKYGDYCATTTERYLGKPFKPLLWRSLMTAFSKYIPDSKAFEAHKESFVDMSMMHSTGMSNNRYGRTTDQAVQSDFRTTIGCIQAGLDFQKHVGIGQDKPFVLLDRQEKSTEHTRTQGDSVSEPLLIENITSGVIRNVVGILEDRVRETMLDSMADILAKYFPKPPQSLDDNHLRPVSAIAPYPSRLQSLRQFLKNPNAQFSCPEQAILLELMCQGKESVLGILGTGKGKTMVVLLYAHMNSQRGVTIVVLPLSSLHDDFARRARQMGVRAARWTPTGAYNPNNIPF